MKERCAEEAWIACRALSTAATAGHEDMLKHLANECCAETSWQDSTTNDGRTLNTLGFVMESSHLHKKQSIKMLELCVELGCPVSPAAFMSAASISFCAQPFEYMEWLLTKGCKLTSAICSAAADETPQAYNRHEAKKYWHYSDELLDELVGNSKPGGIVQMPLARVKWLHARDVPMGAGTMSAAAKHNNIHLLEWAYKQGCEPSENTMHVAAYHGQVASMKWLVKHGCAIGSMSTIKAAANAQQHALLWLMEQGAPFDKARAAAAFTKAIAKAEHQSSTSSDCALIRRGASLAKNEHIWGHELSHRLQTHSCLPRAYR